MVRTYDIIVYGSYGYTGQIIVEHCLRKNLNVLLSGRNGEKLNAQSQATGYPYQLADIGSHDSLTHLLEQANLVIHCAGPFQFTAKQMADACLDAGTHYTDITGEFGVFELLAGYDSKASSKGIVIMPGVGFDVVPTDCLSRYLKDQLPSATHLQLAFTQSRGALSRGTARTAIENLGQGSMIRSGGRLMVVPMGQRVIDIDFGPFTKSAVCIPWGDISTAYRSTGIPNIEVYTGMPRKAIRLVRISNWFNWLLRMNSVKNFLRRNVDGRPPGPDKPRREQGRSYLWGRVWDEMGNSREARLETLSGYELTAATAVLIAEKIIKSEIPGGVYTPAQYFGADLILEIPFTRRY